LEHTSTWIWPFFAVLRVVKVFPQPQATSVVTYSGWMPVFMVLIPFVAAGSSFARMRS
jgi:hypothetical protein